MNPYQPEKPPRRLGRLAQVTKRNRRLKRHGKESEFLAMCREKERQK